jgi:hypothetical protein
MFYVMPNGDIKRATGILAALLVKRGGRPLELKPINLIYAIERERSVGASTIPKPKRSRKPRSGKGEV